MANSTRRSAATCRPYQWSRTCIPINYFFSPIAKWPGIFGVFSHTSQIGVALEGRHLIINLSDVSFIDSSIIHALFETEQAAKKAGLLFIVQCNGGANVERVLAITLADGRLPLASSRAEANELIAKQSRDKRARSTRTSRE